MSAVLAGPRTAAEASAATALANGLGLAAVFASGVWLLLSGTALNTQTFAPALNYLGIAAGVASLVTPILPPLALLVLVLTLLWWVGLALRKESASALAEPARLPA